MIGGIAGLEPASMKSWLDSPTVHAADLRKQRDFADIMTTQNRNTPGEDEEITPERAQEIAEDLVSLTFVQPLLARIRESSQAAEPFHQTSGEKQFGSLLDAQTAISIVRSSNWGIVDQVARSLMKTPPEAPAVKSQTGPLETVA